MTMDTWLYSDDDIITDLIELPLILPNGSNNLCQFRVEHRDTGELGSFQIIVVYTIYL